MSLVNEALRRADEEKSQRVAGVTPPGPPPAGEYRAPPRRRFRRLLILACIVLSVAGAAACGIWWVAGRVIEEATAAVNNLTEQGAAAVAAGATAALPAAVTVQHQTEQPAQSAATEEPRPSGATPSNPAEALPSSGSTLQIDPEVIKRIASSLMSPKGVPAASGAAPATDTTPAGPGSQPKTSESKPQIPEKKDPSAAKAKTASGKKAPSASPAPKPKPKPQTAEKKPPPAALPVDTSHLKVSSIMLGPRGGTAIINGRPVGVGETVGGAKVIKITRRTVEVEIDGRRATLRI